MRILVLDSGVERWKVTPSKSETIWSIETGGALYRRRQRWPRAAMCMLYWRGVPGEPLREERLNQDVLVV